MTILSTRVFWSQRLQEKVIITPCGVGLLFVPYLKYLGITSTRFKMDFLDLLEMIHNPIGCPAFSFELTIFESLYGAGLQGLLVYIPPRSRDIRFDSLAKVARSRDSLFSQISQKEAGGYAPRNGLLPRFQVNQQSRKPTKKNYRKML